MNIFGRSKPKALPGSPRDARGIYVGSLRVSWSREDGRWLCWATNFPWSDEGVGPLGVEGVAKADTPTHSPPRAFFQALRLEGLEIIGRVEDGEGWCAEVKYFSAESLRG